MNITSRKGYMYTLEALIGVTLILVSIVVMLNISQVPASFSTALIKRQGFEALEFLDQSGELRPTVFAKNKIELKNRLRSLLPPSISFDLDICTVACFANVPQRRTVISVDYYIDGYHDTFSPKKVKLWMWGSF